MKKLFVIIFTIISVGFFNSAKAGTACEGNINFYPTLSGKDVILKGVITMTDLDVNGYCNPTISSKASNIVLVRVYSGTANWNRTASEWNKQLTSSSNIFLDASSKGKGYPFEMKIVAPAATTDTLPFTACVFSGADSAPITCSSVANVTNPNFVGSKIYGCKAADGKYACAANQSDIKASWGGECSDPKNIKQIESSSCGKTDTEITSTGTVDNGITGIQNNSSSRLFNPLPEDDLTHAFLLVLQGLLSILGILAVVFVVVGGVQMVVSGGNEEAITKAKKTITWAVLGLVAALLSFSMIAIVQELLQADLAPATNQTQTK